jgi:hypothetical protein
LHLHRRRADTRHAITAMGDGQPTSLDDLKKLILDLAGEVTSLKADQARLHVTVNNVQSNRLLESKDKSVAGSFGGGVPPPTSHKLRFPKFDGSSDPLAWLHRCDQFFRASRTPKEDKVWYATFYMDGDAQQWYFRLERNQGASPTSSHGASARQREATRWASSSSSSASARWPNTRTTS